MRQFLLIFIVTVALSNTTNALHPIKVSTCWIIQENNKAKITFNFFADDFGAHLKTVYGDFIDLETYSKRTHKSVLKYINKHFSLQLNSKQLKLVFKKKRLKGNVLRIEFVSEKQISYKEKNTNVDLSNTLLLEAFKDQTNIVRIDFKGDGNYRTVEFEKGKEQRSFLL